jgi:hypothetical protein
MEKEEPERKRQKRDLEDEVVGNQEEKVEETLETVEKERVSEEEEPIVLYQFSPQLKEHLIDEARCDGFWAWIHHYAPLYGLPSLFRVFDYDLPPELLGGSPEELLPLLKAVFLEKVLRSDDRRPKGSVWNSIFLLNTP